MNCRICGSPQVNAIGDVEYYSGFAWPVYDCSGCDARFTRHDETIYDALHSDAGSCYNVYRDLLERSSKAFKDRDLEGLKRELYQAAKYKFIIEEIEYWPQNSRLLEFGCARGCLTSYFILAGYQITGVDVSASAVKAATAAFGDHFVTEGDRAINAGAPYDVIYHVGTIGCVADPLGFTERLLRLLKPGGCLLFNSPNLQSCGLCNQLWIDAAPPPDLVSIFPPGFWRRHFAKQANVVETIESCEPRRAVAIGLSKALGRRWKRPVPISLHKSSDRYIGGAGNDENGGHWQASDVFWQNFERGALKFFRATGLWKLFPPQPTDFGIFVHMTRK